jgi:hypothetical protein
VSEQYNLEQVIGAISLLRTGIEWKQGKASAHLAKRIKLKHLPSDSSLIDYKLLIARIAQNVSSEVYVYVYKSLVYPTLTLNIEGDLWLVMIGLDGVMETAFPPSNPRQYFDNEAFFYLGTLGELWS